MTATAVIACKIALTHVEHVKPIVKPIAQERIFLEPNSNAFVSSIVIKSIYLFGCRLLFVGNLIKN